jgi:hypothetical protein
MNISLGLPSDKIKIQYSKKLVTGSTSPMQHSIKVSLKRIDHPSLKKGIRAKGNLCQARNSPIWYNAGKPTECISSFSLSGGFQ